MANRTYPTIHQHEPLRVPSSWGAEGKRFVAQLEEIFDDMYAWRNRIKITDFSEALRTKLVTVEGIGENGTTEIDGGRVKTGTIAAARIDVDNLNVKHLDGAEGTFAELACGFWTYDEDGLRFYKAETGDYFRLGVETDLVSGLQRWTISVPALLQLLAGNKLQISSSVDFLGELNEISIEGRFFISGKRPALTINGKSASAEYAVTLAPSDIGAEVSGAATSAVSAHNSNANAHSGTFDAAGAASAAVSSHNTSENAHSGTFDVSGAANSAVSSHDESSGAHTSLFGSKQTKITATGILKGDGSGSVSAATADTDFQRPIAYGATEPSNPFVGQIWLKPKA